MKTEILRVNPTNPEADAIARAAKILARGGLVAFPTETVYGLGARAFDAAAVAGIFAAKERPATNPLIVHFAEPPFGPSQSSAPWFAAATRLATSFWPGPLTMVLPKPGDLPKIVTGGGSTWAVRVPDHTVAHALLRAAGPLAAPSANVSTSVSPTTAEHVLNSLAGKIDLILDGGPCAGGIESTVLDLTCTPPRVLRPGLISTAELSGVIGPVVATFAGLHVEQGPSRSPGTSLRHYAPRATLECYSDEAKAVARFAELAAGGKTVRWLRFGASSPAPGSGPEGVVQMPGNAPQYATRLYAALHEADRAQADYVIADLPPASEEWLAVRDRLRRGATVWNDAAGG
jgi:L-threonylcarbamoyladenylate synthase